jgi:SPP1 gp7 family putative phage head morphogenesis protein
VSAAILSAPLAVKGADGGKLLDAFISDWSAKEVEAVTGAIRVGAFHGRTNAEILRTIRGTKAANYADGLLAVTDRHAAAVVQTAVQHVASVARMETWKRNSDIVTGYRWVSTLDSRTTDICMALDGQVFKYGKGPTPPAHVNCRSTTVAELDSDFDFLKLRGERASQDGPVDGKLTYYDWLLGQPKAFQNEMLGPFRAELLRSGGLSASEFGRLQLDRNFTPISLARMQTLDPLAFDRAGIAISENGRAVWKDKP